MKIADLRTDYMRETLDESEVAPDPYRQFERWFAEAVKAQLREPNAMTLATVDSRGQPAARIVLLKVFDPRGFVFFTNYESRKGRELAANPGAALLFFWPELERQVRITGAVARTTTAESDAYFHSRPVESQVGAAISRQSRAVADRSDLEARYASALEKYKGSIVPLPSNWGGYRVSPETIEFWQGRKSRLHDRLRYTRQTDKQWVIERLSP